MFIYRKEGFDNQSDYTYSKSIILAPDWLTDLNGMLRSCYNPTVPAPPPQPFQRYFCMVWCFLSLIMTFIC
ncbi:hypothetical protein GDO81_019209 [Engystomops pustulosus]|uniref:Uncharacterized protein n=1 Tax=Engystomops pustulosus TaxID=76066 RepID=A0AAV6YKL8_ENGPU|nr:hypothetical protein GDO81_019209 [Engystomops pustulosus]